MGMDLKPINPSNQAPRYSNDDRFSPNELVWGRYNWSGWSWLRQQLKQWDVDTSEMSGMNDGAIISEATCLKIADAIEKNLNTLQSEDRKWIEPHIARWRTCGGYEQW